MLRTLSATIVSILLMSTLLAAPVTAHGDQGRRLPIRGADVSSLLKSEQLGGVYRTAQGRKRDALRILRSNGLNWIRLRVFVDPADGYHGTPELLEMALRAKRLGIKVLVDLHYSDFWADPGKQWTPEAWEGLSFEALKRRFVRYTRGVVRALERQGTPPDMIQLGNEIRSGMLWDHAATWTGCSTADEGYPGGATRNRVPYRGLGRSGRAAERGLSRGEARVPAHPGHAPSRRGW